jgi:nitrogen fixation/metabolism regulation signal transduction histidine kinase
MKDFAGLKAGILWEGIIMVVFLEIFLAVFLALFFTMKLPKPLR